MTVEQFVVHADDGVQLVGEERVRSLLLASTGDPVSIDGVEMPARWFREVMAYEPARDLRAIRCPVLAIVGSNDVQVDVEDVERRHRRTSPISYGGMHARASVRMRSR